MNRNTLSRRRFLRNSAISGGAASIGSFGMANDGFAREVVSEGLPREVWIGGISQMNLDAPDSPSMVDQCINLCRDLSVYRPDVICLPEVFPTSNMRAKLSLEEKVGASVKAMERFSTLSQEMNCHIICPVYTSEGKKVYNAAVLLDRHGTDLGEYRKIHLTEDEIKAGLTPGPVTPPVFDTDFAKIGIQICFDIEWDDGWTSLQEQGAEIVFWPSAFAGGQMVNTKAWRHQYVVATSTRKNTSKICDISGEVLAQTGIWDRHIYCAPVNLEKIFMHTWPYVRRFDEIRRKYGRLIRITNYHEEEWSIIESLSPDVAVNDIVKEFDLKSHREHTLSAEEAQVRARAL